MFKTDLENDIVSRDCKCGHFMGGVGDISSKDASKLGVTHTVYMELSSNGLA